jgi:hypothetical protein
LPLAAGVAVVEAIAAATMAEEEVVVVVAALLPSPIPWVAQSAV